jgi:catalase
MSDPFERVIDALESNFPPTPTRRAAHAKGLVLTGTFTATAEAVSISRAAHLAGNQVDVVARFSNFTGGEPHADAAPECNPRGLAVQFRLPDGSSTDLLAHSINGFPGRTIDEFSDFLEAIAPNGPGPADYLSGHPAAAAFVQQIQTHGTPASYATLDYYAVDAFRFHNAEGEISNGRYRWSPTAGTQYLSAADIESASFDFLTDDLTERLRSGPVGFSLLLSIGADGDPTDDANAQWPQDRRCVVLGTLRLTNLVERSDLAEQGLFFDPVRLIDGITISDDPLLVGRTRTYPVSLARRHGCAGGPAGVVTGVGVGAGEVGAGAR